MRSRIITLPKKGRSPLREWTSREQPERDLKEWEDLCIDGVNRARSGVFVSSEVFLCLLGDELIDRCDSYALSRLLEFEREHSWGSTCFLVVSNRILISDHLLANQPMISEWLSEAVAGRVEDLLQIPYNPGDLQDLGETSLLQSAASRARIRRKILRSLYPHIRPWRCLLPKEGGSRTHLLRTLVQFRDAPDANADLVIVVEDSEEKGQRYTVTKALERFPDRRYVVVTLLPRELTTELRLCCNQHGLPEPLYFAGDFELWYFLLRLNRESARAPFSGSEIQSVIPIDSSPTFLPRAIEAPRILFTSAFDPDDRENCLAAAKDVGRLLAEAPLEIRFQVEPAIRLERLIEVLGQMPDLNLWIHMGHGKAEYGLYELDKELDEVHPIPVERWLSCFRPSSLQGSGLPLELAIFLTCESTEAAQLFARAGAGMAVGFGGQVSTHLARQLAIQILKAVFKGGLCRPSILKGFLAGKAAIEAVGWNCSEPRAYYPGAT